MASTIVNAPCTVPSIKGFDSQNYVGLRPISSVKFNSGRTSVSGRSQRLFVMRASERHNGHVTKIEMSIEECEAAVVAGNVPDAPPVPPRPAAPVGTPVIQPLQLSRRPRRNRKSPALRASFQEMSISPANFVYPLFIHEGQEDTPIGAMPGCYRLGWRHGLVEEVAKARDVGVNSIVLFPKVPCSEVSHRGSNTICSIHTQADH